MKKNQMTRIRNGNGKHFCVFDALKLKRSNRRMPTALAHK